MKAIIYNDDLGLTYGFTQGIKECYQKGITTSTCIRTNGYAYKYATSLIRTDLKNIGLGLHLNITHGPSHTKGISDKNGNYKYGFFGYFIHCLFGNKKLLKNIEEEFEEQFKIARDDNLKFDNFNGQDHVHMIPKVFRIACKLAKKNKIKYVRICDENYHLIGNLDRDIQPFLNSNFLKFATLKIFSIIDRKILKRYNLKSSGNFYGILHTNNMDETAILAALEDSLRKGVDTVEILSHPTHIHDQRDKAYMTKALSSYANLPNRNTERKALLSKRIMNYIQKNKIDLVSYKNL